MKIFRLFKIVFVLAKNGAIFAADDLHILPILTKLIKPFSKKPSKISKGESLARALEELGPIFIKFGQVLSSRPDIVGEKIAKSLTRLQDELPPFPYDYVEQMFEKETGEKIADAFASFEKKPKAAASIAQVHRARLKNGKDVAVKILRPKIEKIFAKDVELLEWLATIIEKKQKFQRLRPIKIVALLKKIVKLEMDLRYEAAAASELKDNFINDKNIFIPNVHWEHTTKKILIIDWIDGVKIDHLEEIEAMGFNLKEIAKNFAIFFFNQAYRDGFFHADLHPGNIMINKQGQIAVIDFGIMGRLDNDTRIYVAEILQGFLNRNYRRIAEIHFKAGYVPKHVDFGMFSQAIRAIGEPIVDKPVGQISVGRLLAQLFQMTEDFEMETQPQLLLLQKTTILVEGIGASLNPEVNMWKLAEPWIEKWAIDNIGIEAKIKDITTKIFKKIYEQI